MQVFGYPAFAVLPRARTFNGNAFSCSSSPGFSAIPGINGNPAKDVIACFVVVILKLLRFFVIICMYLADELAFACEVHFICL